MQKILTSRHKKLQKDGIQDQEDNAAILGEISNYRMNDSFLAGMNIGGYLETEREDDPESPHREIKIQQIPQNPQTMNLGEPTIDQSVCIEDTSYDLDCSMVSGRSSILSPAVSPRVSITNEEVARQQEEKRRNKNSLKLRLVNDLGQIRLTSKMRDREQKLRK